MSTSSFADRVREHRAGPCRILTLRAPVHDIVTWRASFVTHPDLAAGDDLVQEFAVSLLDKGTMQRDRFELARVAEERGASLNVTSDGLYVDFRGRSLVSDFPDLMDVGAEMLRDPAFDADELEKARAQLIGELQRDLDQTASQASAALSRCIFDAGHPNHTAPPETQIDALERLTRDDVRAYHDAHFGATEMTLVAVGDVDHEAVVRAVDDAFGDWAPHDAPAVYATDAADRDGRAPRRVDVPMPDKANVDVRMGHGVSLRRDDDEYLPTYVGNYILGGNFSARLMNRVRDEMGLTYHIRSGLSGVSTRYDGSFQVVVTLSHDVLDRGVEATQEVVRRFVADGVTADELEAVKTTIAGSFQVGLDTTRQLAGTLLVNAERGFDVRYLDRFPSLIDAVTLDDVNAAIRTHLRPDALHVARAGLEPQPVEAAE